MAFSTFTIWCDHPLCPVPKAFHHPKGSLVPIKSSSPVSSSPNSRQPPNCFVSMDLPILKISCKRNHTICNLSCLTSFTQYNVSEVHPRCAIYRYFIPFYVWIILHYVYTRQCIHPSTDGHGGCSYLLAIVTHAATNMHVHAFVWIPVFSSFGYIPRSSISGSYDTFI